MPPALEAPPRREPPTLDLRVGFVGQRGRDWLGGWVEPVALEASAPEPALDALVVDPRPRGVGREEVERLARRARAAGTPVIGLRAGSAEPVWSGLVDLALGGGRGDGAPAQVPAARPVDPRSFNPLGFRHSDVAGFSALAVSPPAGGELGRARALLAEVAAEEPVMLLAPPEAPLPELPAGVLRVLPPRGGPPALVAALRDRFGALDHQGLHADEEERAAWLLRLCAAGVPVAGVEPSPRLRSLLGGELLEALAAVSWPELLDLDRRERVSVTLRRLALREHSVEARWRQLAAATGLSVPPRRTVSVVLATRRESWLQHGLEQVRRQNYEPRELVVALHGEDFSPGIEERLREQVEGPLQVVRVRSELTLGDALNAGAEAARGDYVSKMDDDDYYSVDHLWDLVLALEYSGADLVGKAAEFVYLEEIDVTIRQLTRDVETRLAGGGLMARRGPLLELGGWPSLSRGEDLALVRVFEGAGRRIHRTHPHGYILNRHGRDHTWRPYVDYFLFRSGRQWRGLRFDQAGID